MNAVLLSYVSPAPGKKILKTLVKNFFAYSRLITPTGNNRRFHFVGALRPVGE
jgi:hypothetical protein